MTTDTTAKIYLKIFSTALVVTLFQSYYFFVCFISFIFMSHFRTHFYISSWFKLQGSKDFQLITYSFAFGKEWCLRNHDLQISRLVSK